MFDKLIKPCPFCGGEAKIVTYATDLISHRPAAYIQCRACESCSKSIVDANWNGENISKVIEAWNRRVVEEEVEIGP